MSKKNKNWTGLDNSSTESDDMNAVMDFDDHEFETDENKTQEPSPVETTPVVEPEKQEIQDTDQKPIITENKEETMPTTEVKHQEITPEQTAPTPAAETHVQQPIVVKKNDTITRFASLTRSYITLAQNGIRTDEQKKQAVKILSDIVFLVTTSHDRAVFDACFSFFLSNRAIMLSEQTVMGNVTHYADQTKINRIVQFYVVFTSLIEAKLLKKHYTININHVRDAFNNRKLAEWLSDKI